MASRDCPVCGNIGKSVIKKVKLCIPKEYNLARNFDIVCCDNCGFCYADSDLKNDNYEYYYKNYNNYSYVESQDEIEKKQHDELMKVILKIFNKDSDLLNIGIGNGNFEKYLHKLKYKNIVGIDPSIHSVNLLTEEGIEAYNGSIYDDFSNRLYKRFDGVFLLNTLEHLFKVRESIEQLINFCKEDGAIIIVVPDIGVVQNNTTKFSNNFNHEHINYFSRISLMNLFSQYGYEEVYCSSTIFCTEGSQESTIISVFKKGINSNYGLINDNITKNAIETYLKLNEKSINIIAINTAKNSNEEIIVWGTGSYTMNLLANYDLDKCNILYYVDNNVSKQGKEFNGKIVKKPVKETLEGKKILICSMLYANEIKMQIEKMNVSCKIDIV